MMFKDPVELYKLARASKGRILCLDVGKKYIGLALTNQHNDTSEPFRRIGWSNKGGDAVSHATHVAHTLKKMITDYDVAGFLIGHPYRYGKTSPNVTEIRKFVAELSLTKILSGVHYTFFDESFSSVRVRQMIYPIKLGTEDEKRITDVFAAQAISQGYLDAMARHEKMESFMGYAYKD